VICFYRFREALTGKGIGAQTAWEFWNRNPLETYLGLLTLLQEKEMSHDNSPFGHKSTEKTAPRPAKDTWCYQNEDILSQGFTFSPWLQRIFPEGSTCQQQLAESERDEAN